MTDSATIALSCRSNYDRYSPQPQDYAVNNLEGWHAYSNVPDFDITAIAHGSTRRWDSIFPHSATGFVPLVPFSSRATLEAQSVWCHRAFETNCDTWEEFGANLTGARYAKASYRDPIPQMELHKHRSNNPVSSDFPNQLKIQGHFSRAHACFVQYF